MTISLELFVCILALVSLGIVALVAVSDRRMYRELIESAYQRVIDVEAARDMWRNVEELPEPGQLVVVQIGASTFKAFLWPVGGTFGKKARRWALIRRIA